MQVRVWQKLIGDEGHEISNQVVFHGSDQGFSEFIPQKPTEEGVLAVQHLVEIHQDGHWTTTNFKVNDPQ